MNFLQRRTDDRQMWGMATSRPIGLFSYWVHSPLEHIFKNIHSQQNPEGEGQLYNFCSFTTVISFQYIFVSLISQNP